MVILVVMYCGCVVVTRKVPEPKLIFENGIFGWLEESCEEVIDRILDATDAGEEARRRVLSEFTGESSAKRIITVIGDQK